MVAVGMLLAWAGYALGLEGWCLWRDYNLTLGQIMSPLHPYSGAWPPATIPAGQIWPGKQTPSSSQPSGSTIPAVQGSLGSEAQQAGGLIPGAIGQAFGNPFTG